MKCDKCGFDKENLEKNMRIFAMHIVSRIPGFLIIWFALSIFPVFYGIFKFVVFCSNHVRIIP